MDNHPIPQDVTHFQFKLIGELTIKQFGYVAAGGVIGWIVISIKTLLIVKLPIALIFAGTGLIFAFIPIEGRPADMMLSYFFRALFHPNQYLFQKQGSMLSIIESSKENAAPTSPTNKPQAAPTLTPQQQYRQSLNTSMIQPMRQPTTVAMYQQQLQTQTTKIITPPAIPVPTKTVITPPPLPLQVPPIPALPQAMTPPSIPATAPIINNAVSVPAIPQAMPVPTPQIMPPQINPSPMPANNQLQDALAQKKQLEEQLAKLQQQLSQTTQPATTPSVPSVNVIAPVPPTAIPTAAPQQTAPVSSVVKTMAPPQTATKLPLVSDFPNIIIGVVKDARGNVLPNILIEVKDVDDNPVRAFKTNALGQFASATPLLNGTYTVLFEDPAKTHKFDALQIAVTGDIMQPIEVVSFDEREGLRKELFG